jgi:hypothetical protein
MMEALRSVAHFLNFYANLFLVVITTIYVGLTWRTLKALKEASLHEREALHLREIKDRVVEPIVSWIANTLVPRFSGDSPLILTVSTIAGKSRVVTHTVDDPFSARQRLKLASDDWSVDALNVWVSTETGRIAPFLFREAKANHFPKELSQFDVLLEEARDVTESLTKLANDCVVDLVTEKMPFAATYEAQNTMPEWTSPVDLAVVCVASLLQGRSNVAVEFQGTGQPRTLVDSRKTGLARAADEEHVRHWAELGFEKTRRRWETMQLTAKIASLLKCSLSVRQTVEELLFTQALGVDCALVSGPKKGWPVFFRRNYARNGGKH